MFYFLPPCQAGEAPIVGHLTPNSSTPWGGMQHVQGLQEPELRKKGVLGTLALKADVPSSRPPAQAHRADTRLRRLPTFPFSPCPVLGPISGHCGRSLLSPEAGFSRVCENLLPTRRKRVSCATGGSEELLPEASTAAHLGGTHGPCEGSQGQNGVPGAASTMADVRGLGRLVWRPQLPDHWGRCVLCPQERHVVVTWEDTSAEPPAQTLLTSGRKTPHSDAMLLARKGCHLWS